MVKTYFKQAWEMMKQNKLFTSIYVAGTALAIATTMIIAIVYYIKIAPIYPETNRNRTYYATSLRSQHKKNTGQMQQWKFSYKAAKEWFHELKNAEMVSVTFDNSWGQVNNYVQSEVNKGDLPVIIRLTDTNFFRIYDFHFYEGKPFSEADLESGMRSAVITEQLAKHLFGTSENVVGKTFRLDYKEHRVTGVVKSASYLSRNSFAQIYLPYSVTPNYDKSYNNPPYLGPCEITLLINSDKQLEEVKKELNEFVRKFNAESEEFELTIGNQPFSHFWSLLNTDFSNVDTNTSWIDFIRKFLLIFLVVLLVPALNLSGMISGRMEGRLSEMGLRKSFGASKSVLLRQVLTENLMLTLLGGAIGLLLAWLALVVERNFIFSLFENTYIARLDYLDVELSGEMLLAPSVFAGAFLFIVLLNLMSALIPAYLSLRHPIIESLNEKR